MRQPNHTEDGAPVPVLYSSNGQYYLHGEHTPDQLNAARAVGYVNRFNNLGKSANDIAREVGERCLPGWRVTATIWSETAPRPDAIRIGQYKVRTGDPANALWLIPTTP